eukprot:4910239-Ditylum_brightwellii.AAC.1
MLVDRAVKEAVPNLHDINEGIYCHGTMRRLLNMFWFGVDSVNERQILENMGNLFSAFGNAVPSGEKLFCYTGPSGYVRMVVSKPGKVGMWMFQVAVSLGCGLPCLIYIKMHTLCMESGRTVACTDIVKDWSNMTIDCLQCKEATLYMDSYYLTDEGRKWLREKK